MKDKQSPVSACVETGLCRAFRGTVCRAGKSGGLLSMPLPAGAGVQECFFLSVAAMDECGRCGRAGTGHGGTGRPSSRRARHGRPRAVPARAHDGRSGAAGSSRSHGRGPGASGADEGRMRPSGRAGGPYSVRRTMRRRRRKHSVRRPVRPGMHDDRGRQHGEEKGSAVVSRRIISSRADADASGINAARTEGHAARNIRPIGVRGAACKKGCKHDGKKSAFHGILLVREH